MKENKCIIINFTISAMLINTFPTVIDNYGIYDGM